MISVVTKKDRCAIFLAHSMAAQKRPAMNEKRLNQIAATSVSVTEILVRTRTFGEKVMRSKPPLNLPLIMMEDITKSFRQGSVEARVLLGIDLTINRGEFVVVFGPSGCGKSTLLAIMGLLDSPSG